MSGILSAGVGSYGVGKIVAGLAVDKLGPKRVFVTCLLIISLACTVFGSSVAHSTFLLSWALLRFFQSYIWPAAAKVSNTHLHTV